MKESEREREREILKTILLFVCLQSDSRGELCSIHKNVFESSQAQSYKTSLKGGVFYKENNFAMVNNDLF